MQKKSRNLKHIYFIAMLFLFLSIMLSNFSFSGSPSGLGKSFCKNLFSSSSTILKHTTSLNSMLAMSFLAILVMFIIVGILYAIGFAFKINKLVRLGKTEIGEIIVTVIIVFVFLGAFSLSSSTVPTSPIIKTNMFSDSLFINSCSEAATVSAGLVPSVVSLMTQSEILTIIQSLKVTIMPNYFGIAFSPFAGLSLVISVIGIMVSVTWMFILLMAGIAIFIFIIYSLFPIFLFAGIILRTIPWTRAAGGAFLGIFIGFFVLLPLLLSYLLSTGPMTAAYTTSSTTNTINSFLGSSINSFVAIFTSIPGDLTGYGIISPFITDVVAPALYAVIGSIISLIITIDFSETVGDFLGAPSLTSSHVLKKLI